MNEKEPASCKYCGWKIPPEFIQFQYESHQSLCCEYCGSELPIDEYISIHSSEGSDTQPEPPPKLNKKQKFRSFLRNLYEKLPYEKNPIIKVGRDSDFSENFKQNFIIVIARLLYPHISEIKESSVIDKPELTKGIIDKLFDKISPIFNMRIDTVYLTNLHKMSIKEFEGWLKKLQAKLRVSNQFHQNFTIYLRWLIREVFVIVTAVGDPDNFSNFEKVIRKELEVFDYNLSTQNHPEMDKSKKNEDFKYRIYNKDTVDAVFLKNILNTIYLHERSIVEEVRDKSGFQFASSDQSDPMYYNFKREHKGLISSENLKCLLGVGDTFLKKYIKPLDSTQSQLWFEYRKGYGYYKNTILRLRNSLNNKCISQFDSIFRTHFDLYIERMNKNVEFLYKYLFLLSDYVTGDISVKFRVNPFSKGDPEGPVYIRGRGNLGGVQNIAQLIIPDTSKSLDAFFGFLIETLTAVDRVGLFNTLRDIVDFKSDFIDLAFEYGKELVFNNDFIPREQFDFMVHSLYAYNSLGKRGDINDNNPMGLYLLADLSKDFTNTQDKQAIKQQLRRGTPTIQVFEIIRDLRINQLRDRQAVGIAIEQGERYEEVIYSDKISRSTTLGILAHKPIQLIIYQFLKSKGILGLGLDTRVLSDRQYNPDQSLRVNSKFLETIDLALFKALIHRNVKQTRISFTPEEILHQIQYMVWDYTLTSSEEYTIGTIEEPGKVRKHYQSPSTFFLIINYNKDLRSSSYFDKKIKTKMIKNDLNNPEMVSFISVSEFIQLIKIKDNQHGDFLTRLNKILTLIETAKSKRRAFNELRELYNDALVDYNKLKASGIVGGYIGDLD
ncbi:MAG: hypothetical protein ACFFCI_08410 [Promethearchaeota archaeon]